MAGIVLYLLYSHQILAIPNATKAKDSDIKEAKNIKFALTCHCLTLKPHTN
jgi:hypothetical protein